MCACVPQEAYHEGSVKITNPSKPLKCSHPAPILLGRGLHLRQQQLSGCRHVATLSSILLTALHPTQQSALNLSLLSFILSSPLLSPHLSLTILRCVTHHLCRAGRPIITPACEYWSTAPVCACYFKTLRPVISLLMIVIAENDKLGAVYSAARRCQREAGRPELARSWAAHDTRWWEDGGTLAS